ncbi:MAG: GntR family transcriptional regulator [Rhizobiaceae bacterium]
MINSVVDAVNAFRLKAGDRLIERELSEATGAGRMAIRNALVRLAGMGLVELSQNRGALIIQPDADEAGQMFEARRAVEEMALRKLAATIDEAGLGELRDIVEAEDRAYEKGRVEDAYRLSRSFHLAMSRLAGNAPLTRFLEDLMNCQPLLSPERVGGTSKFHGTPTHFATIEALERGDGERAARLNSGLLCELETTMMQESARKAEEVARPAGKEKSSRNRRTGSSAQKARRGLQSPD